MYETGYYVTGYYATGYYMQDLVPQVDTGRFTWEGVITEARELLSNTNPDYVRWSDEDLLCTLNRGIEDLKRVRPDAFYTLYGIYPGDTPEVVFTGAGFGQVNWDSEFLLERRFYSALVHYVTAYSFMMEDSNLGLAQAQLQLYREFALT